MVKKRRKKHGLRHLSGARGGAIDLLWAARGPARRGPKPALSVEALVTAAIAWVDANGLGALTMARLARELGVTTMALYRYVPGKHELLELMSDRVMGAPPLPGRGGWRAEIARWARAYLALLTDRPWLLGVVEMRTTIGPNSMAWLDAAITAFAHSTLPRADTIAAVLLVDGHVRSTAQLTTGAPATAQWADNFGRVLEVALKDERYAAVKRLVLSGSFAPAGSDGPIPFEFGLERILDGLEVWMSRSSAASPP